MIQLLVDKLNKLPLNIKDLSYRRVWQVELTLPTPSCQQAEYRISQDMYNP